jgi:AcrR family transcriptional regulator
MSSNSRSQILDGALRLVRAAEGRSITLEAVAREVGLSKPGVMYHFPTKRALMLAVVDHVAAQWEEAMLARLGTPLEQASTRERIRAYVEVALDGEFDRADYAICTDAFYRDFLAETWVARLEHWFEMGSDVPPADRGRIVAARLIADGYWMADATDVFRPTSEDRRQLRALVEELLEEPAS